ncbi:Protein of unknown function (DUF2891) [Rivularia sp. PCC 7116]|uniref:DUF2891 domain-containing protein n=1 Tax=Rivularia sp. PCC 7116 TaxID=373994 RepID=UPI00029EDAA0|nr:DUF2891 domain-containing protein [Rivularia sp. PCC 7116]AFY58397.1 Protein of unknown function (DUF2891) [Rivularia sp. PCC 7116]
MEINQTTASKLVELVLNCVDCEYPHSNIYWLNSDEDVKPPRELTPAFYGCLDWHSSVHGHWLLARLARGFPEAAFSLSAKQALEKSLTSENIEGEVSYLKHHPRFEIPYGVAWLLQLVAELREWDDVCAKQCLMALQPLEIQIAENLYHWLKKLIVPNRTGMHKQTAFGLGLIFDWAQTTKNTDFIHLIEDKVKQFYFQDRNHSLRFEPLGHDFLSPCLAEADLIRRTLTKNAFADWLTNFLPDIPIDNTSWLNPVEVNDAEDYMQAHFYGLNLSRAWMIEGIISGLPNGDRRIKTLINTAAVHRQLGLANAVSEHYAGSHWLGTFAVYLATSRGLVS